MYLVKSFIAPAIHLCINRHSQATAHHSPKIYLYLELSVKMNQEAGETFTHAVLLVLNPHIPLHFDSIERHQHLFNLTL